MSEEQPASSPARRYVLMAVKLAVSVALLAVLFSRIDVARLWTSVRRASVPWLLVALSVYFLNVLAATWRWHLLLAAQDVQVRGRTLLGSFLVALFFNNFLPSNIGGDVVRISDTARAARSKTLAATVVLVDRGIGLMGLVLVAAMGATIAESSRHVATPIWPSWLWAAFLFGAAAAAPAVLAPAGFGRLLRPLTVFHPEWVGGRIEKLTAVLARFRDRPTALAGCFGGAIIVQATIVVFYVIVAYAAAPEPGVPGPRGHRADVVRGADAAAVGQRIRRAGGHLRVVLPAGGPAARVGAPRLAGPHSLDHALLAGRRRCVYQ